MSAFVRGNVYFVDIGYGEKPWLVVSNNGRNQHLPNALAVRITTTEKPPLPTIVELSGQDPLVGRVVCDDISVLYADEPFRHAGALTANTMMKVGSALRVALAL